MSEKLNLDVLISSTIHSHNYIKVDGTEASNSKYVSSIEKEAGVYSSPRNIRKLFIKNTGIDIVYYRPVVGREKSLSESISFNQSNRNLLQKLYAFYESSIRGAEAFCNNKVSLSGTGFAAFLNDLSVSNLEELYFDWTMLLGNKELFKTFYISNYQLMDLTIYGLQVKEFCFHNSITENSTKTFKQLQAEEVDTNKSNSLVITLMNYIKKEMCGNKPGGIISNYPRLKHIGFIGNSRVKLKSDRGITKKGFAHYDFDCIYNNYASINAMKNDLCSGDKFKLCTFIDTGADLLKAGFRVDAGLYKFDKDILYNYFKNTKHREDLTREEELNRYFLYNDSTSLGLESKLEWLKRFRDGDLQRQQALLRKTAREDAISDETKKRADQIENQPRTEIEKVLSKILKSEGEQSVLITLGCLEMQYTRENLLKEIEKFSPIGSLYYKSLLERI